MAHSPLAGLGSSAHFWILRANAATLQDILEHVDCVGAGEAEGLGFPGKLKNWPLLFGARIFSSQKLVKKEEFSSGAAASCGPERR